MPARCVNCVGMLRETSCRTWFPHLLGDVWTLNQLIRIWALSSIIPHFYRLLLVYHPLLVTDCCPHVQRLSLSSPPFPLFPFTNTGMSASDGVHGTLCNAQQYEQSLSSNPRPSITCLTHGQSIGLAVRDRLICVVLYSTRI
jgi:hypothetical protein